MGFTLCSLIQSNTCFQSHAKACAIIITYLDLIFQFLSYGEQNKASQTLNHMERNVKHGCKDNATQYEFAVITIYYQAIGGSLYAWRYMVLLEVKQTCLN